MKDINYDKTKSNINFITTQKSYADNINKIKYNIQINDTYKKNLRPKNKMNIYPEKPITKILSSDLDFKALGLILFIIVILGAISFFLLFFIKNIKKKDNMIIFGKRGNGVFKVTNETNININNIGKCEVEEPNKKNLLRRTEEYKIEDGYIFNISDFNENDIIKINIDFINPLSDLNNMFEGCDHLINIDLSKIDNSIKSMSQTFKNCNKLEKINLKSLDTSKVVSMDSLFEGCSNLVEISGIEYLDTSSLKNISRMFYNCTSLIIANLSSFDLDNIKGTDIFFNNNNLEVIDLRNCKNNNSLYEFINNTNISKNITIIINDNINQSYYKTKFENFSFKFKNENIEINCTENCDNCNKSSGYCKKCKENYYLPEGEIFPKSICRKCGENCSECIDYTFSYIGKCNKCDNFFYLFDNECSQINISNCIDAKMESENLECINCSEGFKIIENECIIEEIEKIYEENEEEEEEEKIKEKEEKENENEKEEEIKEEENEKNEEEEKREEKEEEEEEDVKEKEKKF